MSQQVITKKSGNFWLRYENFRNALAIIPFEDSVCKFHSLQKNRIFSFKKISFRNFERLTI